MHSDTHVHGRISDIGRGECYVEVMSPFAVGSDVKIKITTDKRSFGARGKVLYSTGGMGMGLAFTEIEPGQLAVLQKWIAELSGEAVPELKAATAEPETRSSAGTSDELRNVVNELIITLIRKRVLTDAEGKALLLKLLQ